jgi:O-antigen/teichoic acid export membrane protein
MLARKSLLIMTANITEGILAYVALFFIASYMGPTAYGIIGFAMGFVGLFTILNDLGFNPAHIKQVSEGKDLGRCIGTYITAKIGFTGLLVSVVIGAVFFWKFVLGRGFESTDHELAIYIILGYFVLRSIAGVFHNTFRAKREIAKSELPVIIRAVARTGAIIFVAISGLGPMALACAYVFGDVFFLAISAIFFTGYPVKKPSREYFRNYVRFAKPLIIVGASVAIMTNLDKVLIQLFWHSDDVGYYFASYRITHFIVIAASSIGILLFPTISSFHANKDIQNIKKTVFLSERYISMLVFPMVIGLAVLAEPTVRILLRSSFYPAIPIFRILPFFALVQALTIPYNYQIIGMDKPKLARNRVVIMVCTNVALNIILIPQDIQMLQVTLLGLGAVGAAIATVAAYLVGMIYCRIAAWKLTQGDWNPRILLHLLAASAMGAIIYGLNDYLFAIERWYHLLGFAALGIGIYLFILFLLKEFTREDFNFLVETFNIKKMGKYIAEEIKKEF